MSILTRRHEGEHFGRRYPGPHGLDRAVLMHQVEYGQDLAAPMREDRAARTRAILRKRT